jgi:hypothetical protein
VRDQRACGDEALLAARAGEVLLGRVVLDEGQPGFIFILGFSEDDLPPCYGAPRPLGCGTGACTSRSGSAGRPAPAAPASVPRGQPGWPPRACTPYRWRP